MINLLSLARVLLLFPMAWLLVIGHQQSWPAWIIFIMAGITDFLDGYLARKFHMTSALGAMLDQICDKIFIIGVLVAMVAAGLLQNLMLIPVFLIIAREFLVAGLREYAAQQVRSVPVDQFGKIKTTLQFLALALLLMPVGLMPWHSWLNHAGAIGLWLAMILGLISAWRYAASAARAP
jgi:CDP-diacylglycerol--glycerol-3-phosphate 3-phosphatidyltransferase